MQSARDAVKGFLNKTGKHETDVHEHVAPAVQHENIERQQREEVTTAVDKEVHQDHYHTTVQPVKDNEVLPEEHHHRAIPVEHREYEHGNAKDVERKLQDEAARFKHETTRTEGATTSVAAPTAGGQHVHHHVHETIQPVVEKSTIEPHVVHTTVPVHEVHHNAAQHHTASTLPAVSLGEFERGGGSLTGREERVDHFEGQPRTVGNTVAHEAGGVVGGHHGHGHHHNTTGTDATHSRMDANDSAATRAAQTAGSGSVTDTTGTGTHNKPSFMDKLNPKVDADGDGKTGIMD